MARSTKVLAFSVPVPMAEQFDVICKEEGRTKSDLFRAMFRVYAAHKKNTNPGQIELFIAQSLRE